MFKEHIRSVVDRVDGGIGGVLMGLDGIAVDTYMREGAQMDVNTIGMEFSFILTQVKKAGQILELGNIREFSIKAEKLLLVIRMLTDDYFLAVAMTADGNFGKARYLMRLAEPRLTAQL